MATTKAKKAVRTRLPRLVPAMELPPLAMKMVSEYLGPRRLGRLTNGQLSSIAGATARFAEQLAQTLASPPEAGPTTREQEGWGRDPVG